MQLLIFEPPCEVNIAYWNLMAVGFSGLPNGFGFFGPNVWALFGNQPAKFGVRGFPGFWGFFLPGFYPLIKFGLGSGIIGLLVGKETIGNSPCFGGSSRVAKNYKSFKST